MEIVSIGDNLHEMSKPVFLKKKKEKGFKMITQSAKLNSNSLPYLSLNLNNPFYLPGPSCSKHCMSLLMTNLLSVVVKD